MREKLPEEKLDMAVVVSEQGDQLYVRIGATSKYRPKFTAHDVAELMERLRLWVQEGMLDEREKLEPAMHRLPDES